jgi:hypothetical protein
MFKTVTVMNGKRKLRQFSGVAFLYKRELAKIRNCRCSFAILLLILWEKLSNSKEKLFYFSLRALKHQAEALLRSYTLDSMRRTWTLGLHVNPDELQLQDELNTKWVQLWKETVLKQ